jgi:hypothetical protein
VTLEKSYSCYCKAKATAMRKVVLLAFFFSISFNVFSQGILKGKLVDSVAKQALSLATITVFKAKDTTIVTYRLSDGDGNFKVTALPLNTDLRVVITSSGYKVFRRVFNLTTTDQQLDLGKIFIQTDTTDLDEVLVFAERPPVSIKKDTIEFNAAAFKTLPEAVVEDLLKKLPGVEIDPDGSMKINGRVANKILVDSKEFFGSDPKIATKNLPANLIDKVQVTDDKEQLERNPDIPKAELGVVINLKLKRAIKKSVFGKVYGGIAPANRNYETGAIVNSFRDTFQVSILAHSNNINRTGFSYGDLNQLGGFNRSGFGNDGGNVFGGSGSGLQRSGSAGININHDPSDKIKLNFQYFYGRVNSDNEGKSRTQQFINDTVLQTKSNSKSISNSADHRFSLRFAWKIDSMSSLEYRPTYVLRTTSNEQTYSSVSSSNYVPKINESENEVNVKGKDRSYSHDLSYRRRFEKKGRNLFITNTLNVGENDNDQFNHSDNIFYTNQQAAPKLLNQLRQRDADNFRNTIFVSFNEQLSKKLSLTLYNNFYNFRDNSQLTIFDRDTLSGKYIFFNDSLSYGLQRNGYRNTTTINLNRQFKKFSINPGAQFVFLNTNNTFTKNVSIEQHYFYVLPSLNIAYNGFNVGYRENVTEPSGYDLRPVVDNTNPLYQVYGNPDLKPTKSHMINAGYYKYLNKKLINFNANSNLSIEENTIIRSRSVDDKGVQTTRPVNINGVWRFSSNMGVSKQYKFQKNVLLSLRSSFNYGISRSFILVNNNKSAVRNVNINPSLNLTFNWKDKFELTQRYTYSWRKNQYDNNSFRSVKTWSHSAFSQIIIRAPKNWIWESSIDYRYNPQVSPGFSKNIITWNAGINYLFLKDHRAQFKLSVNDLLKQNTNAYRWVGENYISDSESNALTRYFMLTFTYNIRDFRSGKTNGHKSFFNF